MRVGAGEGQDGEDLGSWGWGGELKSGGQLKHCIMGRMESSRQIYRRQLLLS